MVRPAAGRPPPRADLTPCVPESRDPRIRRRRLLLVYSVCCPELFDAFQQLRWPLLRWLKPRSAECDTVMEALVRAITFCEDADEHNSSPNAQRSFGTVAERRAIARQWTSLTQPGHVGRFVPDTEARAIEEATAEMGVAPTYEAWLRAQTQSVDTEVNVQLGEYTLKNTLQPLPSHISVDGDFVSVFGVSLNANPIQCVEVEASTHRLWLRLVGQRHDVQLWDADPRHPTAPFSRPYTASARESADGDAAPQGRGLRVGPRRWRAVDRARARAVPEAVPPGRGALPAGLGPLRPELRLPRGAGAPGAEGGGGLKEVVVFRSPGRSSTCTT